MSINMVIVLMHLVGGDNAAAAFVHAAMSNILEGVFLSPLLILGYLSMIGSVNLVGIFSKLAVHVLLPILFGQVLQLSKAVRVAVVKHKKKFKHMSF
jgi:sodium/bile acid cotransporter 7